MSNGKVVILAGSPSDDPWVDKIEKYLGDLGVDSIRRIASAHRVPEKAL
ncbi:MAG: phosphoribosylcarboxyaminoimidazole (NCAIR) mutase, partial [Acidimicrobiales bacterium]